MATLTVNIDDDVKAAADRLYKSMGMNLTTAVNVFFRKSLQVGGVPFPVTSGVRGVWVDPSTLLHPKRGEDGVAVLPADWDDPEDDVYDALYQ
ncbi:MAG: hypothetical protein Q4C41_07090 [Eggerthellaceae bacterium]|nr:hypothetical protein [Eggerthellaceae bacterium]